MLDDITQAVLSHEEVARYLRGGHGQTELQARERIHAYLDELRTTQRYPIYRALKHPLYPILRKIERIDEHVDTAQKATRAGRVIYISNHKSHLDYLVEPLVLDDNAVRPPVIAAGINLFGGPLGLIHRHVTGAIPIRRNTKDPAYLVTLKAYVAELLQRHDLLFYIEGGRSYSGELKAPKTGLLHAAMQAGGTPAVVLPMAVAYDVVLEDHILAHQGSKRRQRAFGREVAEMVRYAVGYQSRAYVTFGTPITFDGFDPESRRDVMALAHHTRDAIGLLHKVLPTAVLAAALHPSITRRELEDRADAIIETVRAAGANMGVASGRQAVEEGAEPLAARNIIHRRARRPFPGTGTDGPALLRAHPAAPAASSTHPQNTLMIDQASKAFFHTLAGSQGLKHLASRYGMRRPNSFAHRFIAGETIEEAIAAARAIQASGLMLTLDQLGESVANMAEADAATRGYLAVIDRIVASGIERNISLKLTQLGLDGRPRDMRGQPAAHPRRRRTPRLLRAHRHGGLPGHPGHARSVRDDVAAGLQECRDCPAVVPAPQRRRCPPDERTRSARPPRERRVQGAKGRRLSEQGRRGRGFRGHYQAPAGGRAPTRQSPPTTPRCWRWRSRSRPSVASGRRSSSSRCCTGFAATCRATSERKATASAYTSRSGANGSPTSCVVLVSGRRTSGS